MSSILTNNSAMVALQTLKSINTDLSQTQATISTGKEVSTAKDNSAVWAISKVMESDVKGFQAIEDSLNLGSSTVAVARNASETVTDLLTDIKGKVVAAQESNVDRTKIQSDVTALVEQIESVIGAAQFNGLNLVDGTQSTVNVLSSLDRDSAGGVSSSEIAVTAQDLSIGSYSAKNVLAGSDNVSANGDTAGFQLDNTSGTGNILIDDSGAAFAEGDSVSITVGDETASYTVSADDVAGTTTSDLVAVGLKNAIDALGIEDLAVDYDSGAPGALSFTNTGTQDVGVSAQFENAGAGGLGALSSIDVSSAAGATAALGNIEALIDVAIDAASAFGSVEGRIEIQADFISSMSDSLTAGIGSLVDANMEETSARLQALQVQPQLGVQSLSIANQAPQSILSLFR
jgi:flagellin